jgi:ABC-2 type transport system ATP-binding protein
MQSENAIEVKDVSKSFKIFIDKGHTVKERVLFRSRRKYEHRQVLKGISFSVKKGEAIGLIGHNGCGKSTTLKLLTRIMYPNQGTIEINGRISSLIELGAGFHPDMSGRENIYINASIFGLSRREIERRMDDIVAFSELEEYLDNPVRTYSSGMYMRLAFSVAINVDADVLLIDEILSVGDANFQAKCFNKLREIKAKGTTIVIVSHSLGQIEQICERSLWIHDGEIKAEGSPCEIHEIYLDFMEHKRIEVAKKEAQRLAEKHNEENSEEKSDEMIAENGEQTVVVSQETESSAR